MDSKDIEIEIKVKVEKIEPLKNFLNKNAKLLGETRQIDEYFTPAHRDFTSVRPVSEWLRLRNDNGKYKINYKNWHYDKEGKSQSCDEFESSVKNIEQIKKLFFMLNFKPLVKVDKKRVLWDYKDYIICLDIVENLGTFVEIEFKGGTDDPKKVTVRMIKFLKDINVGKIQRNYQGYPFLLLFPEEAKYFQE